MGGCLRPHDSLWDGAHDARLTGDVVDEILGGKVDRADWSVAPDDPRTGARPRHKLSLPYPAFSSCPFHLRHTQNRTVAVTQVAKTCVELVPMAAAGRKYAEASTAAMGTRTGAGAGNAGIDSGRVVLEHLSQSTRGKDG